MSAAPVPQPRAVTADPASEAPSGAAPDVEPGAAPEATAGSGTETEPGATAAPGTDTAPASGAPAAPAPGVASDLSGSGSSSSRRSLAAGLLLGAVGATVVLLASGQTWAEGLAATGGGALPLTADGQDVTGAPAALAIVGLAALVAVFAVRGVGRRTVAVLLALSGLGATVSAWVGASDSTALDEQAARTTGDTAATIHALTHTAWPYVTAAGGLLILLAGLLALRYGSRWPTMSGRYERDGTPRPRKAPRTAPDPDRPEELWKALDRGEDPTG
ncbi:MULTISPECIES: TIGR02234 family membrane protein [Streptomyces]|uniref:TIGR02234 family membrane protein n=1 Tax=Streptomyces TaxID=1883 RepID=UPI00103FEF5A|nr:MULTISPECIES: TIGR02234 family membrane protein [Streptomyces]MBT3074217.1 TIGR02234 family membrane protein [Streptomyces sp. COG21]MBT3084126.1 TIGR02234 family membrane protein [Streptomyces sp. COG20]MBT3086355.1 TIGR02234 family membrane protein [Streptomyces sp. CYG21]MBT3100905.1 TIGR02234 family membrane protein [Streptomyces sp. CBG30]MBT3101229.1 TIGR02234 family membrane protein [Streptomyces sp. COG19]